MSLSLKNEDMGATGGGGHTFMKFEANHDTACKKLLLDSSGHVCISVEPLVGFWRLCNYS